MGLNLISLVLPFSVLWLGIALLLLHFLLQLWIVWLLSSEFFLSLSFFSGFCSSLFPSRNDTLISHHFICSNEISYFWLRHFIIYLFFSSKMLATSTVRKKNYTTSAHSVCTRFWKRKWWVCVLVSSFIFSIHLHIFLFIYQHSNWESVWMNEWMNLYSRLVRWFISKACMHICVIVCLCVCAVARAV